MRTGGRSIARLCKFTESSPWMWRSGDFNEGVSGYRRGACRDSIVGGYGTMRTVKEMRSLLSGTAFFRMMMLHEVHSPVLRMTYDGSIGRKAFHQGK